MGSSPGWKRLVLWSFAGLLAIAVLLLLLQGYIRLSVLATSDSAVERFGGDRISGLAAMVNCSECRLKDRDMAVWALGELRDRRALPVLRAHYKGGKCNHSSELCQYNLGKAILKIEGRWDFHMSRTFRQGGPEPDPILSLP